MTPVAGRLTLDGQYGSVFGWGNKGDSYVEWLVGDKTVGGCLDLTTIPVPESVPAHWLVYFAVADVDASTDRAKELGGTVNMPPTDIPNMGRFAVLCDPQAAVFAVYSPTKS